jgi:predicted alpha/beta superfamily hydrolase
MKLTINSIAMAALGALLSFTVSTSSAQTPSPSTTPTVKTGKIERISNFQSKFVSSRHIDVWLPEDYNPKDQASRYQVLYMHDGQNLFDPAITWNKQAWNVHEAVATLVGDGKTMRTIIVAIPNAGDLRFAEYFPRKAISNLAEPVRSKLVDEAMKRQQLADEYLRFIVDELKPAIDKRYNTLDRPEYTAIAGASMGGLISLYAFSEYPEVFGRVAAFSTHWIGGTEQNEEVPAALMSYFKSKLPSGGDRRIYMDHGTTQLDEHYGVHQVKMDAIVKDKGFNKDAALTVKAEGAGHSESAWAARAPKAFEFLLRY